MTKKFKTLVFVSMLTMQTSCFGFWWTAEDDLSAEQQYILAVNWQPSFCELHTYKPECVTQTAQRADARQFSLHGLWPQPIGKVYCSVADTTMAIDSRNHWDKLPPLTLTDDTREQLYTVMPGSHSNLHRHEWFKHGTCYGDFAEKYFQHSLKMMDALNNSEVRDLFANNIGRSLTFKTVQEAFDREFGFTAGQKIIMTCAQDDDRTLIVELKIQLAGDLEKLSLPHAIQLAPKISTVDCKYGIVDPVGLQ